MPKFATRTFLEWHKENHDDSTKDRPQVLLFVDVFNNYFYPQTLQAAYVLLRHWGYDVALPPGRLTAPRPLIHYGWPKRGKQEIKKTLEQVGPFLADGVPVIFCEPSTVSVFRDERLELFPAIRQAPLDRGKLLRPALLLLSGSACGAITPDHIRAATVLELIHNATLLHDDVLDQGCLRRGQPTVNRRWGNPAAVRLGDALLSRVLALSIRLPPDVRATFGRVIRRTCDGEIRQTANAGNLSLTEREYLAIVRSKTAALFEGACYLGTRLAGASPRQRGAAARFGYHTGMAYQIMDDLLDLVGDSRVLRKTLGTDLRSAKLTLPLIHALRVAGEPARASLLRQLSTRSLTRGEVLPILAAGGTVDYVLARIRRYERRAAAALRKVRPTPGKAALLEVPQSILREAVEGSADDRGLPRPRPRANTLRR